MKGLGTILLCLLCTSVLQAQQNDKDFLGERVSLYYQQTPIRQILSDLDSSSSLNFNYFDTEALNTPINLDVKGETLEYALEQLFEGTNLQYLIKGNYVTLKRKLANISLKGKIRDKITGEPLSLAAVSIKGKPVGIVSNPDGQFGLILPSHYMNDTLYITMLGYKDYELTIDQVQNTKNLNVALETEDKVLEEIMILSEMDQWKWVSPKSTLKTSGKKSPLGLFTSLASLEIPAAGLSLIDLRCGTGKLSVFPSQDNQVKVEAEILTRSLNEKETLKFIKRYLDLSYKIEGDTAYIRSFFSLSKSQKKSNVFPLGDILGTPASKINLKVFLPPHLTFKLIDGSGGVQIENLENDVLISDGSGKMQIKNINGNLRVYDASGYLSIENIKGDVFVKDRSGHLKLNKIKGNLTVRDHSGGLIMREIGDDTKPTSINIKDNSGIINAKKLMGDVELRDRSGGIIFSEVEGKIKINDRSGGVHIYGSTDSVYLKDRSGRVITKDSNTNQ